MMEYEYPLRYRQILRGFEEPTQQLLQQAYRLSDLASPLSHLRRDIQAVGGPDDLPLPGGASSPAGHPVSLRWLLGLRTQDCAL